ncbi:hypothetical protein vBEcoMWL3_gp163c [Escherichia phage vB_EcoM_WL-3]|nr:hypothetical protein vBEcoMWL3_gp163c [Escherichia phage vB_EcoM_WL-3]
MPSSNALPVNKLLACIMRLIIHYCNSPVIECTIACYVNFTVHKSDWNFFYNTSW